MKMKMEKFISDGAVQLCFDWEEKEKHKGKGKVKGEKHKVKKVEEEREKEREEEAKQEDKEREEEAKEEEKEREEAKEEERRLLFLTSASQTLIQKALNSPSNRPDPPFPSSSSSPSPSPSPSPSSSKASKPPIGSLPWTFHDILPPKQDPDLKEVLEKKAKAFREEGNLHFSKKDFHHALIFYNKV